MKTAIVTGANGFIGSHLVYRLLAQSWHVLALGRNTPRASWRDRVLAGIHEAAANENWSGQLDCREMDLTGPSPEIIAETSSSPGTTTLFHVAGDTSFRPPNPDAQRRINVEVPVKLAAAFKARVSRLVHISTAYVAGKRTGLIREDELDCGQEFWNNYEKTKLEAEVALAHFCEQERIPLVVIRPSIIVNDRNSGRASTFTHLNALVEVVSRLQDYYGLSDGQVISKTIRLVARATARPNLAPVNSILPPLLQIAESALASGRTFHLCHPRPQTNAEIMDLICEAYQVKSLLRLEFVEQILDKMSHTEEMVARSLKVYAPYLNNLSELDLLNTRSIVPDYDSHFSPLDLTYIRKVIEFQRQKHRDRRSPGA